MGRECHDGSTQLCFCVYVSADPCLAYDADTNVDEGVNVCAICFSNNGQKLLRSPLCFLHAGMLFVVCAEMLMGVAVSLCFCTYV